MRVYTIKITVKKVRVSQKEKGPLESQEGDG
jgi:hypothetical protein